MTDGIFVLQVVYDNERFQVGKLVTDDDAGGLDYYVVSVKCDKWPSAQCIERCLSVLCGDSQ